MKSFVSVQQRGRSGGGTVAACPAGSDRCSGAIPLLQPGSICKHCRMLTLEGAISSNQTDKTSQRLKIRLLIKLSKKYFKYLSTENYENVMSGILSMSY